MSFLAPPVFVYQPIVGYILFGFSAELITIPKDFKNPLWIKFLELLSVNNLTHAESIVLTNRLSVIYTLLYGAKNNRKTRELTKTEKRGYDIESLEDNKTLKIEVKGSEKSEPNLFLTTHEYEVLINSLSSKNEEYYVYIVGNLFENPKIYRLKGSAINDADTGVNLESYKWKKLTKVETIYY